jgi:hypothetical protein
MNGRLPVRLVMMNSLKQARMRCLLIRHQASAKMPRRTGPIAARTPAMAAVMMSRGHNVVCSASSTQPPITSKAMKSSGSHHQMARMTGQAATTAAAKNVADRVQPPAIYAAGR